MIRPPHVITTFPGLRILDEREKRASIGYAATQLIGLTCVLETDFTSVVSTVVGFTEDEPGRRALAIAPAMFGSSTIHLASRGEREEWSLADPLGTPLRRFSIHLGAVTIADSRGEE